MSTRYCNGCKDHRPTTAFGVRSVAEPWLASRCRACLARASRERYARGRSKPVSHIGKAIERGLMTGIAKAMGSVPADETQLIIAKLEQRDLLDIVRRHASEGVTVTDIVGRCRKPLFALARRGIWTEMRFDLGMSLPDIGNLFGRHHTTILSATDEVRRAKNNARNCERMGLGLLGKVA